MPVAQDSDTGYSPLWFCITQIWHLGTWFNDGLMVGLNNPEAHVFLI